MTPSPDAASASSLQDEYDALSAQITKQGSVVRQLKKDGAVADAIADAVQQLQALKLQATELQTKLSSSASSASFQRKSFDDLMIRKMFIVPSFEIHGGVKGLYDLGPPACALKVC
jgi:glycyl-tRNA synthetase